MSSIVRSIVEASYKVRGELIDMLLQGVTARILSVVTDLSEEEVIMARKIGRVNDKTSPTNLSSDEDRKMRNIMRHLRDFENDLKVYQETGKWPEKLNRAYYEKYGCNIEDDTPNKEGK